MKLARGGVSGRRVVIGEGWGLLEGEGELLKGGDGAERGGVAADHPLCQWWRTEGGGGRRWASCGGYLCPIPFSSWESEALRCPTPLVAWRERGPRGCDLGRGWG